MALLILAGISSCIMAAHCARPNRVNVETELRETHDRAAAQGALPGESTTAPAPTDLSPTAIHQRDPVVAQDPILGDEKAVLAAHLMPAPRNLQIMARNLFIQQAEHYEREAQRLAAESTTESTLREFDARFMARLRRVAAAQLQQGKGLLAVGGLDYSRRIRGKRFLLWSAGMSLHGRTTEVLVVLDEEDPELEQIDKGYRSMRSIMLAERLRPFNSKPWHERSEAIKAFMTAKGEGRTTGESFGVDTRMLEFLRIDSETMTVVPIEQ